MHNFQWGFRAHRRCTDPPRVLTLILEMASSCKPPADGTGDPLVLICYDIIKEYPKVQRHLAWRLFHRLGVPESKLRVLSALHDATCYRIRQGRELSDPFELLIGFREGCPTSPICFSIFHNFAISRFLALGNGHVVLLDDRPSHVGLFIRWCGSHPEEWNQWKLVVLEHAVLLGCRDGPLMAKGIDVDGLRRLLALMLRNGSHGHQADGLFLAWA